MIEDISYFVFVSPKLDHLCAESWTNWAFGGFTAGRLWIPTWWILTIILSFSLFFLAYRSALYNLLLEREVERKLATEEPEQPEPAREELAPEPVPAIQEPAPPPEPAELETKEPEPAPEPETQEEIRRRLLVKKALENA